MANHPVNRILSKYLVGIGFVFLQALIATSCLTSLFAQDTLRVVTYNLLFFPGMDGDQRIPHFRTVINAIRPDILVVQELESQAGLNIFLSDVLNHDDNLYQAAPFVDGPFTDSALFFNQNRVALQGLLPVPNTPFRNIMEYFLTAFGEEFIIYSAHFKAGSEPDDQQTRLSESTILRNHLNERSANSNFILVGDYNMRSASESAFIKLIEEQTDNDGRLFDPINQSGDWHENSFFALTHTQSTRSVPLADGAGGGLDDRFDMILASQSLLSGGGMHILRDTYKAFGNDGNKVNEAVNSGVNLAVPDSVADALHFASDHLPVVVDFVFGNVISVENVDLIPAEITLRQNYPNPFNPTTTIQYELSVQAHASLKIYDLLGREVAVLVDELKSASIYQVEWHAGKLASGVYIYKLVAGGKTILRKLVLMK